MEEKLKNRVLSNVFAIAIGLMLILAASCSPPPDSVQTESSDWDARRHILYDHAWGSVTSIDPLDPLDSSWDSILNGGYVTTDKDGQAKMCHNYPNCTCTIYVFQVTNLTISETTISTCPRGVSCPGNATFHAQDCDIKLVTLPGDITFSGTEVTIIENRKLESVIVITQEGTAFVNPVDDTIETFAVEEFTAAYAVTPELREEAVAFFGFEPGVAVGFERFVEPIESLGLVRQIQSDNLLLLEKSLPLFPIAEPYIFELRWLNDKPEDVRLAQSIVLSVDWEFTMGQFFPQVLLRFNTPSESFDVRELGYDPEFAMILMEEGGYESGFEVVLAFNGDIPDMAAMAEMIAEQLQINDLFKIVAIQEFNQDSDTGVFAELEDSSVPVLVLDGY